MKSLHCVVSGKVQGVGFRAWTFDQAQSLELTGWARNLRDGQVEILAQGADGALGSLKERLFQGPFLARVADVKSNWIDYDKEYGAFEIRG